MSHIFVSGCFDIIHGGHIEFLRVAASYGTTLTVSLPTDQTLLEAKGKAPSLPVEHRQRIIGSLKWVTDAVISTGSIPALNFADDLANVALKGPTTLIVTEDDQHEEAKRSLCDLLGVRYLMIPKSLDFTPVSTSSILRGIRSPNVSPLRVDFAGGWLDVKGRNVPNEYVVNCTVTPLVSKGSWPYEIEAGLGGSTVWHLHNGRDPFECEGGWQDPHCIVETGLCVWETLHPPKLEFKRDASDYLGGRMALLWTGAKTAQVTTATIERDLTALAKASALAAEAVISRDYLDLTQAVNLTYEQQLLEGMQPLTDFHELGKKYCGSGHGGYALYMFANANERSEFLKTKGTVAIEPYIDYRNKPRSQ